MGKNVMAGSTEISFRDYISLLGLRLRFQNTLIAPILNINETCYPPRIYGQTSECRKYTKYLCTFLNSRI